MLFDFWVRVSLGHEEETSSSPSQCSLFLQASQQQTHTVIYLLKAENFQSILQNLPHYDSHIHKWGKWMVMFSFYYGLDRITSPVSLSTLVSDTGKLSLAPWLKKKKSLTGDTSVSPASSDFFLTCYISFLNSLKLQKGWEPLEVHGCRQHKLV